MNTEFLKLIGFGKQSISSITNARLIRVSGAALLIGSVVLLLVSVFLK
jgi:hypothetical protein